MRYIKTFINWYEKLAEKIEKRYEALGCIVGLVLYVVPLILLIMGIGVGVINVTNFFFNDPMLGLIIFFGIPIFGSMILSMFSGNSDKNIYSGTSQDFIDGDGE